MGFHVPRGPNPLSVDPHSSTGTDPGLMIVRLQFGGLSGEVKGLVRISNVDANGIRMRRVRGESV